MKNLLPDLVSALRACADKLEERSAQRPRPSNDELTALGSQLMDASAMVAHSMGLARETFVGLARRSWIDTHARARSVRNKVN